MWRESDQDIPDFDEAYLAARVNRFRQIKLRLSPLLEIERGLIKNMGLPYESFVSPPGSPSFSSTPIPDQEYFVRPNTSWMSNLLGRRSGGQSQVSQIRGSVDFDNRDDPGHIIVACGVDIIELWESPFVQAVLQQRNIRIEDEGGLLVSPSIFVPLPTNSRTFPGSFLNDIPRVTSRE